VPRRVKGILEYLLLVENNRILEPSESMLQAEGSVSDPIKQAEGSVSDPTKYDVLDQVTSRVDLAMSVCPSLAESI